MIGYLEGTILRRDHENTIVLVAGVGYRVCVLERMSIIKEGGACALYIFSYNRDGATELYGFFDYGDLEIFEQLLSVSGVGPKSALAVLRLADAEDIRSAIIQGNADLLKKVSGIGSKTAERIVVELRGTLRARADGDFHLVQGDEEIVDALVRLGYSRAMARDAVSRIPQTAQTPEEKIKEALKRM